MNGFDINAIRLKVQAQDISLTDDLKEYISEQIEKQGKLFDRITACDIVLRFENNRKHICEADVKLDVPGNVLYAKGTGESFHSALGIAFKEMHDQLAKYKEKLRQ